MNRLLAYLPLLVGLLILSPCSASEVTVNNAWVREAPPVSKVQAAYMEIHNNGNDSIALVSASSPAFSHIEFHRTEMSDGIMRMLQEKVLSIPAGGKILLQPDGTHMMLFNPVQPLKEGEQVPFTLTFSNQEKMTLLLMVKKATRNRKDNHRCGHH